MRYSVTTRTTSVIHLLSTSGWAKRRCAALLFGTLISPAAYACYSPPREQVVTPDEQIAMATDVVVAKVVRETISPVPAFGGRANVDYEFEAQERILGNDEPRFVLSGAKGETRSGPSIGRPSMKRSGSAAADACTTIPTASCGRTRGWRTLSGFPRQACSWRSFEHIETVRGRPNPADQWLSYVKAKLEGRPQRPPGTSNRHALFPPQNRPTYFFKGKLMKFLVHATLGASLALAVPAYAATPAPAAQSAVPAPHTSRPCRICSA